MDDTVIRQATPDDLEELVELRRIFTNEDPPEGRPRADFEEAFRAIVGKGLRDGSWVVWLAESDAEIIGHAFVAVVPKVPRPVETPDRLGYLTNVYIRPDHRRHGIGGKLLAAVTEWARQHELELLIVWPSEQSVSLYRRHGFGSSEQPLLWTNPDEVQV